MKAEKTETITIDGKEISREEAIELYKSLKEILKDYIAETEKVINWSKLEKIKKYNEERERPFITPYNPLPRPYELPDHYKYPYPYTGPIYCKLIAG